MTCYLILFSLKYIKTQPNFFLFYLQNSILYFKNKLLLYVFNKL